MKTENIAKQKGIEDLFYADLEKHSIRFAQYISKNCYEHRFKGSKGWISYLDDEDDESKMKRFTIQEIYKKFMIDYLCS